MNLRGFCERVTVFNSLALSRVSILDAFIINGKMPAVDTVILNIRATLLVSTIILVLSYAFADGKSTEFWAHVWHMILSVVSIMNLWSLFRICIQGTNTISTLICTTTFTCVCAFRSFLPRIDAERMCFFSSPLSYPFIGRTGATFAEICFAFQVSRSWGHVARKIPSLTRTVDVVANLAFILCTLAQAFCWAGVLTTNNLYHAIEESHWLVAFALMTGVSVVALYKEPASPADGHFLRVFAWLGTIYCAYMFIIDVPMYIEKWRTWPKPILSFSEGLQDSMRCGHLSQLTSDWVGEMPWLTGYFSAAVWASQYLAATEQERTQVSGTKAKSN